MAAGQTVKVLISGEVQGRLGSVFSKVASVNAKNGPFAALFCVGAFFPPQDLGNELSSEVMQYMRGEKRAPIPTYFIGGYGQGSEDALAALQQSETPGNVHYLGHCGVKQVAGLSVVFLDGKEGAHAGGMDEGASSGYFTPSDVKKLQKQVEALEGDVDLFLTCDWPHGVTNAVPSNKLPACLQTGEPAACSAAVAELAVLVRPRYHYAGGLDLHFTRPPYLNKDLGAGIRATRFYALASVTNTSKQKSLIAVNVVPAGVMTPEQLSQQPDDTTACPYDKKPATRKRGLEADADAAAGATSADWRWQSRQKREIAAPSLGRPGVVKDSKKTVFVKNVPFAATEQQIEDFFAVCGVVVDVRRTLNQDGKLNTWALVQFESEGAVERACNINGTVLMGRPLYIDVATSGAASKVDYGKPAAHCWFCLSSSAADVGLVVSVGEEAYIALDKGPINDLHALVIPIEHYPSMVSLPVPAFCEVERYLLAVRSCFAGMGKEVVAFERFLTFRNQASGNHCHINVVAIPASAANAAKHEFMQAAARAGFEPVKLPKLSGEAGRERLREEVGDGEYFRFILPDGSSCVQALGRGERWPLNLGREVIAKLAGVPERADWKAAALCAEEVERMVEQYKEKFRDYDIMQE